MFVILKNITNFVKPNVQLNKYGIYYCLQQQRNLTLDNKYENNEERDLSKHYRGEQKLSEQKSLNIAVIGVPNAGKSTFINNIINHRVCPTSSKVHTTRKSNKAIYTTGQTQLVFYDTPGLVTQKEINKHKLEKSFKSSYRHAIQHADMIAVLHDVSNSWTRKQLHSTVIDSLKAYPQLPSVLILNKIDALKSKRITLELIRILTNNTLSGRKHNRIGKKLTLDESKKEDDERPDLEFGDLLKNEGTWSNFSDVFLVSSITGSGLNKVHDYFVHAAKSRNWEFPSDKFTDEPPEELIVACVRARLLDYLPQEIPYNLETFIEYYNVHNDTIYASVEVVCPTKRVERLICGESNGRLKQITERVTSDLVETFGKPISFTISTKPRAKSKEAAN
ncbi:GTPase Era, mitochondrial [Musca domestica]|uniref:GTPase Era, mitochondrial n=1 Tax=Musca domestica TaxID=7370 RepID=A0A1I8N128_MUSDO|nr:GTPase Era, mitochondrial [Musca domestica]